MTAGAATLRLPPPRLRGPGLGWLPAAWRRRETWRVVGRFVLLGPLIGGLPYAWLVFTLPFIYAVGVLPAFVAGVLHATWLGSAGAGRRRPGVAPRAAMGALAGLGAAALTPLLLAPAFGEPSATFALVIAAHGVPAAMLLATAMTPVQPAAAPAPAPARLLPPVEPGRASAPR